MCRQDEQVHGQDEYGCASHPTANYNGEASPMPEPVDTTHTSMDITTLETHHIDRDQEVDQGIPLSPSSISPPSEQRVDGRNETRSETLNVELLVELEEQEVEVMRAQLGPNLVAPVDSTGLNPTSNDFSPAAEDGLVAVDGSVAHNPIAATPEALRRNTSEQLSQVEKNTAFLETNAIGVGKASESLVQAPPGSSMLIEGAVFSSPDPLIEPTGAVGDEYREPQIRVDLESGSAKQGYVGSTPFHDLATDANSKDCPLDTKLDMGHTSVPSTATKSIPTAGDASETITGGEPHLGRQYSKEDEADPGAVATANSSVVEVDVHDRKSALNISSQCFSTGARSNSIERNHDDSRNDDAGETLLQNDPSVERNGSEDGESSSVSLSASLGSSLPASQESLSLANLNNSSSNEAIRHMEETRNVPVGKNDEIFTHDGGNISKLPLEFDKQEARSRPSEDENDATVDVVASIRGNTNSTPLDGIMDSSGEEKASATIGGMSHSTRSSPDLLSRAVESTLVLPRSSQQFNTNGIRQALDAQPLLGGTENSTVSMGESRNGDVVKSSSEKIGGIAGGVDATTSRGEGRTVVAASDEEGSEDLYDIGADGDSSSENE